MESTPSGDGVRSETDRAADAATVAGDVASLLAAASTAGISAGEAVAADRTALAELAGTRDAEGLAGRLDLALLAALAERTAARARATGDGTSPGARESCWTVLDLLRRPAVLRRIERDQVGAWSDRLLALVDASDLTVGPLFQRRVAQYGGKVLFEHGPGRTLSWQQAGARVELLARALWSLARDESPAPIALLGENRLEMALLDLACLTSGLDNVVIPASAAATEVAYMLRHSRARAIVVSGESQLRKVLEHRGSLERLSVVTVDREPAAPSGVVALDDLIARADRVPAALVRERSLAVRVTDRATIMYTSGTTGTPKAIQFSHRNLVFKRFARALALPSIGDGDVFLCFLPLFHTFGRFLEMLGCVFWGARYCFLDSTSAEGLVRGMQRHRPTVFISVPKKWLQLHEAITRGLDPMLASDDAFRSALAAATGGRLAFGLSAAGHLDSDVFRFFRRHGVELLSGFGMTEATGGITMTPVGDYRDDSLGVALPGIDLRLADDGELLIRGPYVMTGYLDPPDGEPSFDDDGWFHTGDLMHTDEHGHLRLIDRKKEIYKNIKGETIAPQRIENMFRDFESVGRAFLIGDHREYNTLLVWPNPASTQLDFRTASEDDLHNHFRSLVVSVNKFLAPYERIVDVALIDRDLDAARGELTPKGTPRRSVVERNFRDVVRGLYRRSNLVIGGVELAVPDWVLQSLGLTARDLRTEGDTLRLAPIGATVRVRGVEPGLGCVGSFLYRWPTPPLNLGAILTSPRLWLGNEGLAALVAPDARQTRAGGEPIEWVGRAEPYRPSGEERDRLRAAIASGASDLSALDLAARLLGAESARDALLALRLVESILRREEGPLSEAARHVAGRAARSASLAVRRRALAALVPAEKKPRFRRVLVDFLGEDVAVLDERVRRALAAESLPAWKVEELLDLAQDACRNAPSAEGSRPLAVSLLRLLADYGAYHPVQYRRIRAFLERMAQAAATAGLRREARRAADALLAGFRRWLGPNSEIAVDPETGQEYRWDDVVAFADDVPGPDRERLLDAVRSTALVREAVFLFSTGMSVRLSEIPPHGVWIRLLGTRHGKSVYRVTVQTRFQGGFDFAVNVNHDLEADDVAEEIHWLILGSDPDREPLVENFGGHWAEHDLWSEEFIAGETLDRALARLARKPEDALRLRQLWPFLAWATLAAYVDFWRRSGKRLEIADPALANVVVPTEDYEHGVRIVSLSQRRPHRGLLAMLRSFHRDFLAPAERQYPQLSGLVGTDVVFSSVLEVLGEREGLARLGEALEHEREPRGGRLTGPLRAWIDAVERRGYVPLRLHFAIERYRRWHELSGEATPQARARTLQELYDTYGLDRLARAYPATRVRFFRETAFAGAPEPLAHGLDDTIRRLRSGELARDELIGAVDELRSGLRLAEDEEYFLARMSYPYLRPEDAAGFVRSDLGGERHSEIVVTVEDPDGRPFRIRHALNPKEVERLHRLFLAANLDVHFRMEHRYLVAIDDRGHVGGGIYYEIDEGGENAHLEKIVVAEPYRRRGVASALMKELANRLRVAGVKTLTTGFFRPEYFYRHGFRIEKRYAGLVRALDEVDPKA
jgi:long-subunit acyl-CoA synthetase (AMP-forming)/GNAT superfamily N-acetyltransferase